MLLKHLYFKYTVFCPGGMFSKFPKVLLVNPSAVCLFNVASHQRRPWSVTFHLWKCELWPLEKWPLILTGPNGAWRTASDRRQMETQDACKDRHTCAVGHRHANGVDRVGVQARGVTGEPRGQAQAGLSLHRKLLRHAGHVCSHVYWPSRHRSGDKYMH